MKKQALKTLAISGLFVLLAGVSSYGQDRPRVIANIPFAFIAGDKTLPAGEYTIDRPNSSNPDMLLIRSADNHTALFLLVEDTQAMRTPEKTELVFNEIGDKYFLSKIWVAGEDIGREVPKPRAERELEHSEAHQISKVATVQPEMQ